MKFSGVQLFYKYNKFSTLVGKEKYATLVCEHEIDFDVYTYRAEVRDDERGGNI